MHIIYRSTRVLKIKPFINVSYFIFNQKHSNVTCSSRVLMVDKWGRKRLYGPSIGINSVSKSRLLSTISETANPSRITLARVMGVDDANIGGNVHGGNILRMLEDAGGIVATKHCNNVPERNNAGYEGSIAMLSRVESTSFNTPMYVGEVAEVSAMIVYTTQHSLQVLAEVWAENVLTGVRRLTNEAKLWYVSVATNNADQLRPVPPLTPDFASSVHWEQAALQYEKRKAIKAAPSAFAAIFSKTLPKTGAPNFTVAASQTNFMHLVHQSDCTPHGYCKGGAMMKLMDECTAVSAAKHCGTPIVTVSLDAINFRRKVRLGSLLEISSRVTYTGSKSLEVAIIVDVEEPFTGNRESHRSVEAYFTFVPIERKTRRVLQVPPLLITSELEREIYEGGKSRYNDRKSERMKK